MIKLYTYTYALECNYYAHHVSDLEYKCMHCNSYYCVLYVYNYYCIIILYIDFTAELIIFIKSIVQLHDHYHMLS